MAKKQVPETSLEAFRSLDPAKIRDIYKRILLSLSMLEEATSEEIAAHMKTDHDRVWKRMKELTDLELVYKPGTKKVLRSGRMGYCYRLRNDSSFPTVDKAVLNGDTVADFSRKIQDISKQAEKLSAENNIQFLFSDSPNYPLGLPDYMKNKPDY